VGNSRFKATPLLGIKWFFQLDLPGILFFLLGRKPELLKDHQVIEMLSGRNHFIRWGDGETANLRTKSSWHQIGDPKLAEKLKELLDYCDDATNVILGVPSSAIESRVILNSDWPLWKLRILSSTRVLMNLKKMRRKDKTTIADAEFWYRNFLNLNLILQTVIDSNKAVLLISGDGEHAKLLNWIADLEHFIIPSRDAFDQYQEIENFVSDWIKKKFEKMPIILLAGGSTSKVLLPKFGEYAQFIDVGSGLAYLLKGKIQRDWTS
jgi:hypothetical protein